MDKIAVPPASRLALRLGIISIAAVLIAIALGILIPSLGINSLFFTFCIPIALVTALMAYVARRDLGAPEAPGYREATLGLKMAQVALGFMFIWILGVAIFFSLLLPRT
jgi:hypothetical protein